MILSSQPVRLRLLQIILIVGSTVAALLLLVAPPVSQWGAYQAPHTDDNFLRIRTGESIGQHFVLEYANPDVILLWFDKARLPENEDILTLELASEGEATTATIATGDIQADGLAVFAFGDALAGKVGAAASLRLWNEGEEPLFAAFQIDSSIFSAGELVYYPNTRKFGDLAFQVRYQRPALGSKSAHYLYATLLLGAGILGAYILRRARFLEPSFTARDRRIALILFGAIALFYGVLFIRPGVWLGPSDFTKDVSYITASAQAVRAGQWPMWSHITCGGMGLIGNPESNTLSVATLFAFLMKPEHALWLLLSLEAGVAAAGTYLLGRVTRLSRPASVLAGLVAAVSSSFAYKIAIGFGMVGGAMALTPWVLLSLILAQRGRYLPWIPLGGLSLIAIFWRGDVHIIWGVLVMLAAWTAIEAIRRRSWRPIVALSGIVALFFLGASVKVLPYLERPELIGTNVAPSVFLISAERHWDDMFLRVVGPRVSHTVTNGYREAYGYQGAYIGLLAAMLITVGLFNKHRYRWHIIASTIVLLVLIDGQLYETVLRHIAPLDALLRMPGRLTIALLPLFGLLAGSGLDYIRRIVPAPKIFFYIIISVVAIDLLVSTTSVLTQAEIANRTHDFPQPPAEPTLSTHVDKYHASQLLEAGYLLPKVCGDQNNPPRFTQAVSSTQAVSEQPVQLRPNEVEVMTVAGNEATTVHQRFVASWVPREGLVLAGEDDALRVITSSDQALIRYTQSTKPVQQVLFLVVVSSMYLTYGYVPARKNKKTPTDTA